MLRLVRDENGDGKQERRVVSMRQARFEAHHVFPTSRCLNSAMQPEIFSSIIELSVVAMFDAK